MNRYVQDFSFLIFLTGNECKPSKTNANLEVLVATVHKSLITETWLCWGGNLLFMFFTTIIFNSVIFRSTCARIKGCKTVNL